jgi:uncharacterized protein (TIGR02266 family)
MNKGQSTENRRKHPRVPLQLLVQVRTKDLKTFMTERAPDISLGGLFLETEELRPEGTMLYFQFTLDDDGPHIEGLGRVVRVVEGQGDTKRGLGVEFVSVEEPSKSRIAELIARRATA